MKKSVKKIKLDVSLVPLSHELERLNLLAEVRREAAIEGWAAFAMNKWKFSEDKAEKAAKAILAQKEYEAIERRKSGCIDSDAC